MAELAWGIIGTGNIARTFAEALAGSRTGELVAVGSRSQEKADAFGQKFGARNRHGSYEDLLADADVDAVYISTPHPMHAEWAIKAAQAGKHILCEKPIGLNHAEAMAIIDAARRHDVFLMEAFMYRCHPQTAKLVQLIREKIVGEVRLIQASFGFHATFDPESRLLKNELGGGGILDVGCYCVSMSRLIAGVAQGRDFADPLDVTGCGRIGETTRVDEWAVASMEFPGGILADLSTGVQLRQENAVRVYGIEGYIHVPTPWLPGREGESTKIFIHKKRGDAPEEITIESEAGLYSIEAEVVAAHIADRQAPPPAMTWADTLGNMKALDQWRGAIGLTYDSEKIEADQPTIRYWPLEARDESGLQSIHIPGVAKPMSRLMMGADNQRTMPHAAVMFDAFFEAGGNAFDTAHIYGGPHGTCEHLIGRWVASRGVREDVVILDKGAHTPFCTPKDLTAQFLKSLDRLQLDYVDIYMPHRDNPDVPVGEFMDVLAEHKRAGRMRAYGASNWTIERIEAANAYADANGLDRFVAISNNFSLPRMLDPVWEGCVISSDAVWREWFTRTQTPLFPWSSQGRGFFSGGVDRAGRTNELLVRCYYSDENFRKLEVAEAMVSERGVHPINIALAYVLCQPFPTLPIIGPRTIDELRSSLRALEIKLTEEEMARLIH